MYVPQIARTRKGIQRSTSFPRIFARPDAVESNHSARHSDLIAVEDDIQSMVVAERKAEPRGREKHRSHRVQKREAADSGGT